MSPEQISQLIDQKIQAAAAANRFHLIGISRHIHNGTDSPNIPGTSVTAFLNIPTAPGGVLDPTFLNGQSYEYLGNFNGTSVLQNTIPIIYGSGTTSSITLTGTLSAGAVSATLSGAWAGNTGTYSVQFDSTEVRNVVFTNGATTMTWSPPLYQGTTGTSQTVIANARFKGGNAPDGTLLFFRNDDDGVYQLWVRSQPAAVLEAWTGVDLGGTGLFVYN